MNKATQSRSILAKLWNKSYISKFIIVSLGLGIFFVCLEFSGATNLINHQDASDQPGQGIEEYSNENNQENINYSLLNPKIMCQLTNKRSQILPRVMISKIQVIW